MLIVIRLGGSVMASPLNPKLISQYAKLLGKLRDNGHQIVAVIGGGSLAREFIKIGQQLGLDEEAQDWLAIHVSRLYALLLMLQSGRKKSSVPVSTHSALRDLGRYGVVVMGGIRPGMTTDAVAAHVAQEAKAAMLVKATDQDGVYDKDPKTHKDAKKLKRATFHELSQILEKNHHKAGIHQILDPIAINILQKANIKTVIVNGYNPRNVQRAIAGERVGTTIVDKR